MRAMNLRHNLIVSLLLLVFSALSIAQDIVGVIPDHIKRQNVDERLQPLGNNLLGDSIDINTGTVHFTNVDVSIPGNFDLSVGISRTFESGYDRANTDAAIDYDGLPRGPRKYMADWDLDIPSIRWIYPLQTGINGLKAIPKERTRNFCGSNQTLPYINLRHDDGIVNILGTSVEHFELSNEMDLYIPGVGSQKLLDEPTGVDFPSDVIKTTKDYWIAKCIPANDGAQGLLVTSPNGTKYYFDKFYYAPSTGVQTIYVFTNDTQPLDFPVTPNIPGAHGIYNTTVPRVTSTLMVSKVEDIYGNWVEYDYTDSLLTSIRSSDDRKVNITYEENDDKIKTINVNGRIWTYNYLKNGSGRFYLESVIRPDSREWVYDFGAKPLFAMPEHETEDYACKSEDVTLNVKHPNGVSGIFTFSEKSHRKVMGPYSGTSYPCNILSPLSFKTTSYYDVMSLVSKTLSGPGVDGYTWTFDYQEKISGEAGSKWTEVTKPNELKTRHVYHVGGSLDGLKKEEVNYNLSIDTPISKVEYEYEVENAVGITHLTNELQAKFVNPRHQSKVVTTQYYDSVTNVYTTEMDYKLDQFSEDYSFGAPVSKNESNDFTDNIKNTTWSYEHDKVKWQLRKPTKTTVSPNGAEVSEFEYYASSHATYANLPQSKKSFGLWQHKYKEFHSDGSVKKVEFNAPLLKSDDSSSYRYVIFNEYHRGILTSMTLPNRTNDSDVNKISATRIVDDNGWVTSVVDFNGSVVNYGYDEIGRLKYVDPSNSEELDTFISWSFDTNDQTIRTSKRCTLNSTKANCTDTPIVTTTTTYDALLRPKLIKTQDADKTVFLTKQYDFNNQLLFESFPSSDSFEPMGSIYEYDELSRLESITTTGGGSVTNEYLAGNKIQVTDAENNITTTTYLAYGSPSYEQATKIESPENVTTDININIFGNIESITQSGFSGSTAISQTEYRAYDTAQRLCQIKRDDVGTTVFNLNANGSINWQAQGQTATSNTSCNVTASTTTKVSYTYDNLGDRSSIIYGDGAPTRTFTMDNNGNIKSITGSGFSQSYNYNSLNLLEDETLTIDGRVESLTLSYGYDTLGNLSSLKYPDGSAPVEFTPNGFGQATQAIRTATAEVFVKGDSNKATYYPNGIVKSFTYGNGIVHNTTLNDRQIPSQIADKLGSSDIMNLSYTYDNNNNITSLKNTRDEGAYSLTNLAYDGLDRLISTTGMMLGIGSSTISYDGLGNIRSYSNDSLFNPSDLTYNYKTNFQLNYVNTTGTNTKVRDFSASDSYDTKGNVLKNGNTEGINTFEYNLDNQMTEAGTNRYTYDGYNRRIKTVDSKGTSYSFYSQAGKLLYRETPEGGINYIFLGDKLIAKEGTGVVSSGDSTMNYKPFGESIEEPKDDVGYTGHKFDTDLGLSYMQARYYDPVIGRFYSNDPVGWTPENPVMSFNRYLYVNNNPYKYTDPDGKFIFTAIAVGLIAYSAYEGYQDGGATGALAEASGYNDAMDSVSSFQSGDYSGAAVAAVGIVCKACKATRKITGPAFETTAEAADQAAKLGYKEVKGVVNKANQKVFHNKKADPKFISRDADGHNGGAFKGADTANGLNKKKTRSGTYDKDLKKIGS